jgi:hypothetical protein
MQKLYNVCVNCWHKEKYCKCVNKKMILIDYNILPVIIYLNKKGFITRFCCGGHTEKQFIYIYINFKNDYSFSVLPDHFILKKNTLYYKNKKYKTKKELQLDINQKIKILKNWVKTIS